MGFPARAGGNDSPRKSVVHSISEHVELKKLDSRKKRLLVYRGAAVGVATPERPPLSHETYVFHKTAIKY